MTLEEKAFAFDKITQELTALSSGNSNVEWYVTMCPNTTCHTLVNICNIISETIKEKPILSLHPRPWEEKQSGTTKITFTPGYGGSGGFGPGGGKGGDGGSVHFYL